MKRYLAKVLFLTLMLWGQNALAQDDPYARVGLLLKASRDEEAMQVLDSLAKTTHRTSNVYQYYLASAYLSLGKDEEALKMTEALIRRLSRKDTLLHEVYFISSFALDHLGKRDQALKRLNKAIKLKPDEISYYINASVYCGEKGNYKTCLAHLDKARKLDPGNLYVLNNLSYFSSMNRQYSMAMDYANRGIELNKQKQDSSAQAFLLNNRGFAQLGMRNFEAAARDVEESLELYPENPYAYYNMALIHILRAENNLVCDNLQLAVLYGYIYALDEMIQQYCK